MTVRQPTSDQFRGSEYGGVGPTSNTFQPQPPDAMTNTELLRNSYLTGEPPDYKLNIEDRRQMMGLKPAGKNKRPWWLLETGLRSIAEEKLPHLLQKPAP